MLTLLGRKHRLCDGISRREFLQAGALGLGGLGLADLLRLEAQGASPARKKSVTSRFRSGFSRRLNM